jgi:hypothetical protein
MLTDAAKGTGVVAGSVAADAARAAVKKVAVHKGAALATKGAALGAAKLSPALVLAGAPAAGVVLPIAAAVGAGYLARRWLRRL